MNPLSALVERQIYAAGFLALIALVILIVVWDRFYKRRPKYNVKIAWPIVAYMRLTEAEHALNTLKDILELHGRVTIKDLEYKPGFQILYKDSSRGWTDLRYFRIQRTNNRYYIYGSYPTNFKGRGVK